MSGNVGARRGAVGRIVVAAICLGAVLLCAELAPVAASSAHGEGNDAKGPLDLAGARLVQHKRKVLLEVRVHGARPRLRELRRFPARVGADDERYLCLQLEGRRIGRRLLCPGGRVRGGKVAVGVSTYGRAREATKRGRIRVGVDRGRSALELRLALSDLRPGRLRWAVLSGWTGPVCRSPGVRAGAGRGERRSRRRSRDSQAQPCLDRVPRSGFSKTRLAKLRRVGCTRASPLLRFSGSSAGRRIALTFDDGPSAYTENVMSILDHKGAKGTFFEVGTEVPGKAAVMKKALAHGHELANHSMRHESLPGFASMRETNARIEAATGFEPCAFRPPGGAYNSGVVGAAAANGMSTVLWDVDTRDWTRPGSAAVYSRAVGGAHPGAIILMHDGGGDRSQTVAALPRIIETLKGRGYELVTVTRLLGERFVWREDR